MSFQTRETSVHLPRALWPSIDSNTTEMFPGPENVARTSVNSPCDVSGSTVILWSYGNTFCSQRKNEWLYSTILLLLIPSPLSINNACACSPLNVNNVCAVPCLRIEDSMRMRCLYLEETGWEGEELLNKVIRFFFANRKYSRSFIKLRLNPWCHMDYFNNLLDTFLDLDRVRTLAVYGRSESSRIISKISWFVFRSWTKVLWVWNDMRVSN